MIPNVRNRRSFSHAVLLLGIVCYNAHVHLEAAENVSANYTYSGDVWDGSRFGSNSTDAGVAAAPGFDSEFTFNFPSIEFSVSNPAGEATKAIVLQYGKTVTETANWRTTHFPAQAAFSIDGGETIAWTVNFDPRLCFQWNGSGNWPTFDPDQDLSVTFDLALSVDGVNEDNVTLTAAFDGSGMNRTSTFTASPTIGGSALRAEFLLGTPHAPPGEDVTLNLEVANYTGAPANADVVYLDAELQQTILVASSPILQDGERIYMDGTYSVPLGAELLLGMNTAPPDEKIGEDSFTVGAGPQTWEGSFAWGPAVVPVVISGVYHVLHSATGQFDLVLGNNIIHSYTLESQPSVTVPDVTILMVEGQALSLFLDNLVVEGDTEDWYGLDSDGIQVQTTQPGLEYFDKGVYFFDFTVIGVDPGGDIVEDGTSEQSNTTRTDGEGNTYGVYQSRVTRGDGSTYTTVVDTGSGVQVSGEGAEPFELEPGAGDAFRSAQLERIANEVESLRRIEQDRAVQAKKDNTKWNNLFGGLDADSMAEDMKDIFGHSPWDLGEPAPPPNPTVDFTIDLAGQGVIDYNPANEPMLNQAASIIKSLITLIVTGWFLWYIFNEIHNFDKELTTVQQIKVFNLTLWGNSVNFALWPIVSGIFLTVITAAPALLTALVTLQGEPVAAAFLNWTTETNNTGELGSKIFHLLHFFLPIVFLFTTIGNLFVFLMTKIWVFKIYSSVLRLVPSS